MKKVVYASLAALTLLQVGLTPVTVTFATEVGRKEVSTKADESVYTEVLSDVNEAIDGNSSKDVNVFFSTGTVGAGLTTYYALYDIDGNGVRELIIAKGDSKVIFDIFTIDGSSTVRLTNNDIGYIGERSLVDLTTDGYLQYSGSNGATSSGYTLYQVDGAKLSKKAHYSRDTSKSQDYLDESSNNYLSQSDFDKAYHRDYLLDMDSLDWKTLVPNSTVPATTTSNTATASSKNASTSKAVQDESDQVGVLASISNFFSSLTNTEESSSSSQSSSGRTRKSSSSRTSRASSRSSQSSSKTATSSDEVWTSEKDAALAAMMVEFGQIMDQNGYEKTDNTFKGMGFVDQNHNRLDVSTDGSLTAEYNMMAHYQYHIPGTVGFHHYYFTIKRDGTPIVLYSKTTNGPDMVVWETENDYLPSAWADIVGNVTVSSSSESTTSSEVSNSTSDFDVSSVQSGDFSSIAGRWTNSIGQVMTIESNDQIVDSNGYSATLRYDGEKFGGYYFSASNNHSATGNFFVIAYPVGSEVDGLSTDTSEMRLLIGQNFFSEAVYTR